MPHRPDSGQLDDAHARTSRGAALWFLGEPTAVGMHAGTITFTAAAPGSHQYLCPVPGHAQDGMVSGDQLAGNALRAPEIGSRVEAVGVHGVGSQFAPGVRHPRHAWCCLPGPVMTRVAGWGTG